MLKIQQIGEKMKNYIHILNQCPLFRTVNDQNILDVLTCLHATVRHYNKSEYIFCEGEPATRVGIILNGSAQICRDDCYGNQSILAMLKPSNLFGETFAFARVAEFPLNVIAESDALVLFIDIDQMISPCSRSCDFHRQMIYNMLNI